MSGSEECSFEVRHPGSGDNVGVKKSGSNYDYNRNSTILLNSASRSLEQMLTVSFWISCKISEALRFSNFKLPVLIKFKLVWKKNFCGIIYTGLVVATGVNSGVGVSCGLNPKIRWTASILKHFCKNRAFRCTLIRKSYLAHSSNLLICCVFLCG